MRELIESEKNITLIQSQVTELMIENGEIKGIIDEYPVVPPDIWDLALWAGKVCMCGAGAALKSILPHQIIGDEKVASSASQKFLGSHHTQYKPPPENAEINSNFHEINNFSPFDFERVNFFVSELEKPERTLILFPNHGAAKNFFSHLPEHIKLEAFLWPANKKWEAWQEVSSGKFRVVAASPAGIFAPLSPQKIIVEDEANLSYILPRSPKISARSLAGRRAQFLKAELITAGRMPSLKTFLRAKPEQKIIPKRKNIILVDIFRSRQEKFSGTDGHILCCTICGHLKELPEKCENCGCNFFMGKRPGLEALAKIVSRYSKEFHVYDEHSKVSQMRGLILATQKGLELCSKINPGLVAWLDLDLELWKPEHNNRYNVFRMLYNSYWNGRDENSKRKILIQARPSGMKIANFLYQGWRKFFDDELKMRQEYLLPPYGYIVEIECERENIREKVYNDLTDAGFFVMDPGDKKLPFYLNTTNLDAVRKILELYNSIRQDSKKSPKITIRSE